jgi:exodeoxyribonuclease VII small subunit
MGKTQKEIGKLGFEQALAELEEIVQQLENQSLELEVTLALFERGKALLSHCQGLLDRADLKVRELEIEKPVTAQG